MTESSSDGRGDGGADRRLDGTRKRAWRGRSRSSRSAIPVRGPLPSTSGVYRCLRAGRRPAYLRVRGAAPEQREPAGHAVHGDHAQRPARSSRPTHAAGRDGGLRRRRAGRRADDHLGRGHPDIGAPCCARRDQGVDAAVLLARMLVPEPMRPAGPALSMQGQCCPSALVAVDSGCRRGGETGHRPSTIVIDHGKVFISETFITACRVLASRCSPPSYTRPTRVCERTFRRSTRCSASTSLAIRLDVTAAQDVAGQAAGRCRSCRAADE